MHSKRELPLWREWAARNYGLGAPFLDEGKENDYYNAGVFLMRPAASYQMSQMRQDFREVHSHWSDQGMLNCWAKFFDSKRFEPLHEIWNTPYPYATQNPEEGYFLHACGLPQQDKLEWMQKLQSIDP